MNNAIKLIGLLCLSGIIVWIVNFKLTKKLLSPISEIITPTAVVSSSKDFTLGITSQPNKDSLENIVKGELDSARGRFAVVVKNLKTGESYAYIEHESFEPGSLYKVWILATVFQQIQSGKLTQNQKLSQDVSVLNDKFNITSEAAELTEGTVTFTVEKALEQMITISHNYAALLLSEKVRLSSVRSFLTRYGFNESTLGEPPVTTAYDIALFFEKLYNGELANPEYTKAMLDLLKKQQLNNKLPRFLPRGVTIAHKTGEIGYFTHDAGIVYTRGGDYVIVVLSESENPAFAEKIIGKLSKAIYEYFTE